MRGSRLGPAALRLAGLEQAFAELGLSVRDKGDIFPQDTDWPEDVGIKNFAKAIAHYRLLKAAVSAEISSGNTPLVLGGDHSIALGSIAGAIEIEGDNIAVLWIDAHADANTVRTSPSGFLHGMPLGFLCGLVEPKSQFEGAYWSTIRHQIAERQIDELLKIVPDPKLNWNRVAWIGLRDVDPGERAIIHENRACFASTMQDVDRNGIPNIVEQFDGWMRTNGATKLWISLDVDAFDPVLAPGTGTAVRGGLTYREGHLLAELLCEILNQELCPYSLVGLDVVETNPIRDQQNETARIAVEWVSSLFGKTILGVPS